MFSKSGKNSLRFLSNNLHSPIFPIAAVKLSIRVSLWMGLVGGGGCGGLGGRHLGGKCQILVSAPPH